MDEFNQAIELVERLNTDPEHFYSDELTGLAPALSAADAMTLAQSVMDAMPLEESEGREEAERFVEILACFFPGTFGALHAEMVERELFAPSIAYLGASAEVRDILLERVARDDEHRRFILSCLGRIGDERVCQEFSAWRAKPPAWEVPRMSWWACLQAGWSMTDAGSRYDLYSKECYQLIPRPSGVPDAADAVAVISDHDDHCRWCGRSLTSLFDFDLRDPRLSWIPMSGDRLRIAICDRCTGYATIYADIDGSGRSSWSSANVRPHFNGPDDEWERLPERRLVPGPRRRSPYEASADVFTGASQIGGFPAWINGEEYPPCPSCNRLMFYIGQVNRADVDRDYEGAEYAFICAKCGVSATRFAQT